MAKVMKSFRSIRKCTAALETETIQKYRSLRIHRGTALNHEEKSELTIELH